MDEQKRQQVEELMGKEEPTSTDYSAVLAIYKTAKDLEDEDKFNIAICKTALNDLDGAIKDLLEMRRAGSEFPQVDYTLGLLYERKKDNAKAFYFYKKGMHHRETFEESKQAAEFMKSMQEVDEESDKIIELKPFKSDVTFKDVVGLDAIKARLFKDIIVPLKSAKTYTEYGVSLSTGVLLYGASGTGKTLIAKAVAGEANAYMLVVRIHELEGEYFSISEKNTAKVFEQARMNAPCVIFLDEFDALGAKRSMYGGSDEHGGGASNRKMVNEFLTQIDGIDSNTDGIMLIGATNRIWDIDSAMKRPGRFETHLYVPPPTELERKGGFKYYLNKKKTAKLINYNRLGRATEGYTQADIKMICNNAAKIPALEKYLNKSDRPVEMKDLLKTISNTKPSLEPWLLDARRELVGSYATEVVDGKFHQSWKSARLEPQEMVDYKEMIDDVMKNTDTSAIRRRKMNRWVATHLW